MSDTKLTHDHLLLMNRISKIVSSGHSNRLKFKSVLGTGTNGNVYSTSFSGKSPYPTIDCDAFEQKIGDFTNSPAVKVVKQLSIKLKNDDHKGHKEYKLAEWAALNHIGPTVYCEAQWVYQEYTYHLMFMDAFNGSLHDLKESEVGGDEMKQAYGMSLRCLAKASRVGVIGMDIKPHNFLFKMSAKIISSVFLADWDPFFWNTVGSKNEATVWNMVNFTSNAIFSEKNFRVEYLPQSSREFARLLFTEWPKSKNFEAFLRKYLHLCYRGLFHYAGIALKEHYVHGKITRHLELYVKALLDKGKHIFSKLKYIKKGLKLTSATQSLTYAKTMFN